LELVWQHVGLWQKVKLVGPKLLTKAHELHNQAVFAGQLGGVEEVVDLLIVGQVLVSLLLVDECVA
jgi:hypothetical protein